MGCDIHFHTEVKIKGQWEHYGSPDMDRNYRLFAKLADVRNGITGDSNYIEPIASPRGLPDDASFMTKFASDYMEADGHSHSYITAEEMPELEKWMEATLSPADGRFYSVEMDCWGYLFGNSWSGFTSYPGDRPKGVEDVRFVFWFDN